ncbi:MAG TPA: xylulokinase [Bryobacteraceae bacterium]|nr:xylulokinase [Bryobacteraceae bacterium]
MYWMGVDVGTGGTRAVLVNSRGQVVAAVTAPHEEMRMERPLWAEQRPENWRDAAFQSIRAVLAQAHVAGPDVRAIGLSGQMHGLVLVDAGGRVVRPSLIWCDQRSQPQVDCINRIVGKDAVLRFIANPMLTGFTLPKLLWVRDHEPETFERAAKLLLPKDYVRFCLTEDFATDVSDASGTGMFDVAARRWSLGILDALHLDRGLLPPAYESAEVAGHISKRAAEQTGLAPGTPVVAGAGDQAASAVGNGIVQPGAVSCTLGTSGVVFAHMENLAYDPLGRVHAFCHAVPGKWHVMGVTQGAGLSLHWLRHRLAPDSGYEELLAEAASAPPGAHGLFWLPYLMGERTPHLDSQARGAWIGLTARHTRADLIRSVIEGVCYSQKDCLDLLQGVGIEAAFVRVSGGGSRSAFWRQLLADVFCKPVARLAAREGSAHGAALLALAGAGEYSSIPEICQATLRETDTLAPRTAEAAFYAKGHRIYASLYPALRPSFEAISGLAG